jgi:hypothetical protein
MNRDSMTRLGPGPPGALVGQQIQKERLAAAAGAGKGQVLLDAIFLNEVKSATIQLRGEVRHHLEAKATVKQSPKPAPNGSDSSVQLSQSGRCAESSVTPRRGEVIMRLDEPCCDHDF